MNEKSDNKPSKKVVNSEVLPPDAAKKLEKELGPEGLEKVEGVLIASQVMMGGPLPLASEFAAYEATLPGAAREIIDMAKNEQSHRHKNTNKDLNGGILHQFLALILGVFLMCLCVIGAIYLAMNDRTVIAALLLGVAVLGVISSVIKSKPMFSGRAAVDVDSPTEEPNQS